jgi:hypothetical protein
VLDPQEVHAVPAQRLELTVCPPELTTPEREAQSISSVQQRGNRRRQGEYGPSDLSAQSDVYMAAVAFQIALLGGGPDAITPAGLREIDRSSPT